jgi:hypothetical protein
MSENISKSKSPIRNCLLFLLMALMISAALITTTYFPYKSYRAIETLCTEVTTGTVVETCSQEKSDSYYYGPELEYTEYRTGKTLHCYAVNTVNLNRTWQQGDTVDMCYNPSSPTEFILRDEHTAENRFTTAKVISILLTAVGIAALLAACAVTFYRAKPKKFKNNIAGETFEEWQERQLAEMENGIPAADFTETDSLSGQAQHSRADLMDSVEE